MSKDIFSKMKVIYTAFDEFSFKKYGFKNENDPKVSFVVDTSVNQDETLYKVTVIAKVAKESEYDLQVSISGVFEFDNDISSDVRDELLKKNAVAILMPYVRSQVSILTAQPDTESVALPIFNIENMMSED